MARNNKSKKRRIAPDFLYSSPLIALLILKILKSGKKALAQRIVYCGLDLISEKTKQNSLLVLEKAMINILPKVEVKARRIGGSTYQVPKEVRASRGIAISLKWLIESSKSGPGLSMSEKLANEIINASNGLGNSIKRKEEVYKRAKANRAFAHFQY